MKMSDLLHTAPCYEKCILRTDVLQVWKWNGQIKTIVFKKTFSVLQNDSLE